MRPSDSLLTILIVCCNLHISSVLGQSPNADSLAIETYLQQAAHFINSDPQRDSALHYLQKMEQLSQTTGAHSRYVLALSAQYRVHTDYRDIELAEPIAYRALQAAKTLLPPDDPMIGQAYGNLGVHFSFKNNFPVAIAFYQKALRLMDPDTEVINELANQSSLNLNIGRHEREIGDYYAALRYFQQVLDIVSPHVEADVFFRNQIVDTNYEIGRVYYRLEAYTEAIAYLETTLEYIETYDRQYRGIHIRTLHTLANAYHRSGALDQSIKTANLAITVQEEYQQKRGRMFESEVAYHTLGEIYAEKGEWKQAGLYQQKSMHLLREGSKNSPKNPRMGSFLLSLGNIYRAQLKPEKALHAYQLALSQYCLTFQDTIGLSNPQIDDIGILNLKLLEVLQAKAALLHTQYQQSQDKKDLLMSLETYQFLLALIDKKRQDYQAEGSQLFLLKQAIPSYESAIAVASTLYQMTGDQDYAEQAFHFAEKSKAVLLFDAVKNSEAKYMSGIPDSLLQQEQAYRSNISFYQQQVYQASQTAPTTDSLLKSYRQHIFNNQTALTQLTKQLEDDFPKYYHIKYSDQPISLLDIQRNLTQEDKQLIEFFFGEHHIYLFGLTSDHIQIHSFSLTDSFSTSLEFVLASLHGAQSKERDALSKELSSLYELLMSPILSQEHNQLIVIPDGKLGYLPFEVLLSESPSSSSSYSTWPYLIQTHTIQYAHSAHLLFKPSIGLASHDQSHTSRKWLGYAPDYSGIDILPYNETEIQRISGLFAGDIKIGQEATVEDFFTHAPSYDLLHLSMHGYPNTEDPMYAYLAFSGDSSKESQLYAYQLFDMQLNADMVVLSACRTGYGPLARGEGIMSLSRAFRYAGCPSIITSLWRVDGSISQDLLWDFYSLLNEKKAKDISLREAKLNYLSTAPPNRQHPRYWANFVLMGTANPIQTQSFFRWQFIMLILVPLLLLGWLIYRNNRLPDHTSHLE